MSATHGREAANLAAKALAQGFVVQRTKKGIRIVAKDKALGSVQLHFTSSDHCAVRNSIARLRRIGVQI